MVELIVPPGGIQTPPSTGILGIPAKPTMVRIEQACGNCHYSWRDEHEELNCRRNPPTAFLVVKRDGPSITSAHPIVLAEHWCGQWQPKGLSATG